MTDVTNSAPEAEVTATPAVDTATEVTASAETAPAAETEATVTTAEETPPATPAE